MGDGRQKTGLNVRAEFHVAAAVTISFRFLFRHIFNLLIYNSLIFHLEIVNDFFPSVRLFCVCVFFYFFVYKTKTTKAKKCVIDGNDKRK